MKTITGLVLTILMTLAFVVNAGEPSDNASSTQSLTVKLLPGPYELPVSIGKLLLAGQPHKYEDPRAGVSYSYGAQGMNLTVYVYDAGIKDIPDGGNSRLVCEFAEAAKRDIREVGAYKNIRMTSERMIRLDDASGEPMIREAVFEFDSNEMHRVSYVWITGAAKNFVKLRFTATAELNGEIPEMRKAILATVITALRSHVKSGPASDQKSGHSITIAMNSPNMEDGFMYLATLGVLADKQPEDAPVCGGDYVPDFESEYGAYQGLIQLNEGSKTTLMKQLRKINDAGFLAEFVWVMLHQDKWGDSAPTTLKLSEFEVWQRKNLKKFERPYFGSITYDHPRPIPVVNLQ